MASNEARVQVGTASWTDKTLIECGRFYPKGCTSAEDRLRYYASQFPMVEVDSSYYAKPSSRDAELLRTDAPDVWKGYWPPGGVPLAVAS